MSEKNYNFIKIILIALIILMIIPKESFYKNEKIKLRIEYSGDEYKNNNFYQIPPLGYIFENDYKKIQNKNVLEYEFEYKVMDKYIIELFGIDGNIIRNIELNSKEKQVNLNKILSIDRQNGKYSWLEIKRNTISQIGTISYLKVLMFFVGIIILVKNLMKIEKIKKISLDNISSYVLCLNFLILTINIEFISKISAVFISLTFIYLIKNKFKFSWIYISLYIVYIYIFFSNNFELHGVIKGYEQYWNSFLYFIAILIWNFNQEEKNNINASLFIGAYVSTLLGITSPNIFNGLYTFAYGAIAMVLFIYSIQGILKSYKDKKNLNLYIYLSGIIISLLGIGESGRRTIFVVLFIYCLFLFFQIFRKKIDRRIFLKIVLGIICITSILYVSKNKLPSEIIGRVDSIINFKNDFSAQQRILMWRRSVYMLLEEPIKGIGTDNFYREAIKSKYDDFKIEGESFQEDFIHPHNEYLNNLVSKGIIAGIFYIYLLYILIKGAIKDKSNNKDLYRGILICFSIFGIFEPYSMRIEGQIFWSLMGMMILESKIIKNIENKKINIIGKICILSIFIIGLYINKRFRYYFPLVLICYYTYYWIKKRRKEDIEKNIDME